MLIHRSGAHLQYLRNFLIGFAPTEPEQYLRLTIGKESAKNFLKALPVLEAQLENNDWIAGSQFSIADITAVCAIDFARIVKVRVGDEYPNIQRWYAAMKERPSYAA